MEKSTRLFPPTSNSGIINAYQVSTVHREEEKSRNSTQPTAPEGNVEGKSFPAPDDTPSALITQLLQTLMLHKMPLGYFISSFANPPFSFSSCLSLHDDLGKKNGSCLDFLTIPIVCHSSNNIQFRSGSFGVSTNFLHKSSCLIPFLLVNIKAWPCCSCFMTHQRKTQSMNSQLLSGFISKTYSLQC